MSDAGADKTGSVRSGSFLRSVKMVAWSFFGIRKNSEYQDDLAKVNPLHVMVVGVGAALMLVVGLIVLVNWVVAK